MSAQTSRGLPTGSLESAAAFVFVVVVIIAEAKPSVFVVDVVALSGSPVVGCRDPVAHVTLARPFVVQSPQEIPFEF